MTSEELNNCSDYKINRILFQNVKYCAKTPSDIHNIRETSRLL